jgi:hypothetical protein
MACVRVPAVAMANVPGVAMSTGMSAEARDGHRAQAYDTEQQTRNVQIHEGLRGRRSILRRSPCQE